jgi:hypothetical protein
MKCIDGPLKYVGQTEGIFGIWFKEHIHAIRNNNSNSGYSNHTLNAGNAYGAMTDDMDIIGTGKKGDIKIPRKNITLKN